MDDANWLTILEMSRKSCLLSLWKTIQTKKTRNLNEKIKLDTETMNIETPLHRIQFTESSFLTRSIREWNRLPETTRRITKISQFKKQIKQWIIEDRTRQREPD